MDKNINVFYSTWVNIMKYLATLLIRIDSHYDRNEIFLSVKSHHSKPECEMCLNNNRHQT